MCIRDSMKSFRNTKTNYKDFYSYELFKGNLFDPLPVNDIPQLTVSVNNAPSEGKIFISNFPFTAVPVSYTHLTLPTSDLV